MRFRAAAAIALSVQLLLATGARSQSESTGVSERSPVSVGKEVFQSKGSCSFCHGWAGDGHGNPRSPGGANLRRTQLSRAGLIQVISCGRPGTAMPHFDVYGGVEHNCYTVPEGTGDAVAVADPPRPLQPAEIGAVADYLLAKVVRKGDPTREECVEFFAEAGPCKLYSSQKAGE